MMAVLHEALATDARTLLATALLVLLPINPSRRREPFVAHRDHRAVQQTANFQVTVQFFTTIITETSQRLFLLEDLEMKQLQQQQNKNKRGGVQPNNALLAQSESTDTLPPTAPVNPQQPQALPARL